MSKKGDRYDYALETGKRSRSSHVFVDPVSEGNESRWQSAQADSRANGRDLGLEEDLQAVADRVPPDQYGYATAREFAIGKYSGARRRARYAKM